MLMMNDLNIRFFDSASLPAFIGCKWGVGCMCLFVFDLCQLRESQHKFMGPRDRLAVAYA